MTDRDYVFKRDPPKHPDGRWNWVETCLLGDIRTALDGVAECYCRRPVRQRLEQHDGVQRGGGNLALPVMMWMAVDFMSYLYSEEQDGTLRARHFISEFFPGHSAQIGWLLWDGMRNAMTHCYLPREYDAGNGECIRFVWFSEPDQASHCLIVPEEGGIAILVNIFGFYGALRTAAMAYRAELRTSEDLQKRFRRRWQEMETRQPLKGPQNGPREEQLGLMDMRGEAAALRKLLETGNPVPLF